MQVCGQDAGNYVFKSTVQPSARSGKYGYAIRVLPKHAHAQSRLLPGLILWAENNGGQDFGVPDHAAASRASA
jgi:hypothetical protein